jgi:hypothetical protein
MVLYRKTRNFRVVKPPKYVGPTAQRIVREQTFPRISASLEASHEPPALVSTALQPSNAKRKPQ